MNTQHRFFRFSHAAKLRLAAGCAAAVCGVVCSALVAAPWFALQQTDTQNSTMTPSYTIDATRTADASPSSVSTLRSSGGSSYTAIASTTAKADSITLLSFDESQIRSIGNQTSGKCSWFALRYARTVLDGKTCSGKGMWSNGAVWSAGGYVGWSGSLSECLTKIYNELNAGRPVIVHLQNTYVSGVSKHSNRTSTYEYHRTSSGWSVVQYPHIATSSTYGHWVCVVGISADADPDHLKESDFFALDPARVTANGALIVTRLLDGTIWTTNSPLKIVG
jgi:hypothetical protein